MTEPIPLPSNRSFGTVFIVVFFLLGLLSWWKGGNLFPWLLGISAVILLVTLAIPRVLTPLNRAWMMLAEIMNRIVSPVVLGVIFFGLFTPVASFMRLAGRDALKRRFEPHAKSYWIERDPPGPDAAGLPDQF